jgi:hypothetical protein
MIHSGVRTFPSRDAELVSLDQFAMRESRVQRQQYESGIQAGDAECAEAM